MEASDFALPAEVAVDIRACIINTPPRETWAVLPEVLESVSPSTVVCINPAALEAGRSRRPTSARRSQLRGHSHIGKK